MSEIAPSMQTSTIETEALIIGAGPVGLFQIFELGLLEIQAQVIDSLHVIGGQCVELYPHKPIYDIPAIPFCTGQELIDRLQEQIKPFDPTFHLEQEVTELTQQIDGRFLVLTSKKMCFLTKTIFIAAGVGSFQVRTLKVPGIEKFDDQQLFYKVQDPALFNNQNVVICGDNEVALDWAIHFVGKAQSVTLIHRRDSFKASPTKISTMKDLCAANKMQFKVGQITDFEESKDRLTQIQLTGTDGLTEPIPLDKLLVFLGLSPKLGPIADWGLDLERKQVVVDTEKFSTNVPGIFAVGDINTYPGKKKLILSGFHEATLAAFAAKEYLYPEHKIHLLYTTTSPKLHKILGVQSPTFD